MPEIEANGVRLHHVEHGAGEETVVLSHSYLVDHGHFDAQIRALADGRRVLAYDHRDHGGSARVARRYTMEDLYRDGVAFVEATGAAPCHWIGLSTGGFVGLRIALRRPELLRSLVLMDTSADAEGAARRIEKALLIAAARVVGLRPLAGRMMRGMFGRAFLRDPARAAERAEWRRRLVANDTVAMVRFGRAIFSRESVHADLARITTPTLVVVGEDDRSTPPRLARRIAEGIPGARLAVIPRAGHLCTVDEPDVVTAVLLDFLDHQSRPAAGSAEGSAPGGPSRQT